MKNEAPVTRSNGTLL